MSNIKSKQGSSKKKTIIIVSSVLVVLIGLGAGLGVAFGGTSRKASDTIKTTDPTPNTSDNGTTNQATSTEGTYWKVVEEKDPNISSSQLKTLRVKKEAKTEQHLKDAYAEMATQKVDVTSFNELLLPYHLRDVVEEKKAKEIFHVETLTSNQFGYIFNKSDYKQGTFKAKNIVELNLPETIVTLIDSNFLDNKIRKVNWAELTNLKTIGHNAFQSNKLTGNLDLSGLTSLSSSGFQSFVGNRLTGTLTLPPNITTIHNSSFGTSSDQFGTNKISGTLILPSALVTIGSQAFMLNNIEVLDWSKAESLETIKYDAFAYNQLKTLDFSSNVLPKIKSIETSAFRGNLGQNDSKEMFKENFTLPPSLKTLGAGAIKVKNDITITVSANATGVNANSFEGTPKFNRLTS